MNSQYAHMKRLAGMAVMATLVTTAGWGLASGTAKADVARPDYRCDYCFHGRDHRFDRDRDFRGVYDRGFFNPFFGFRPRY